MMLHKLERRNYGGKSLVSIKYQNLHSFKKGLILVCQSILEMRRITYLHGSVHFTIPLKIRYCERGSSKSLKKMTLFQSLLIDKIMKNKRGLELVTSLSSGYKISSEKFIY